MYVIEKTYAYVTRTQTCNCSRGTIKIPFYISHLNWVISPVGQHSALVRKLKLLAIQFIKLSNGFDSVLYTVTQSHWITWAFVQVRCAAGDMSQFNVSCRRESPVEKSWRPWNEANVRQNDVSRTVWYVIVKNNVRTIYVYSRTLPRTVL